MSERKLAKAICKAMEHRFEISIRPPSKHLPAWTLEVVKYPDNPEQVRMSKQRRIMPDVIYESLPKELENLVESFRIGVEKVYKVKNDA